jgi:hypothetical protein
MWCRERYTSHLTILFHVKQRERFELKGVSDVDQEQVQRAWGKQHNSLDEYLVGRDGDHLLVPFECDLCVFRKLTDSEPVLTCEEDKLLLACIRQISLDEFWSRPSSTVTGNRDKVRQGLALSKLVGLKGPFVHYRSITPSDTFGYEVASRRAGKYSEDHTQWDSIRNIEWHMQTMTELLLKLTSIIWYSETIRERLNVLLKMVARLTCTVAFQWDVSV